MKAFVLCAGQGLRLRPATQFRPKPLIPVAGVPALRIVLASLQRAGVNAAVANLWHMKEDFLPLQGSLPGVALSFSEEDDLLDTGGGLARAWDALAPDERFFYHNGDILFGGDLLPALQSHDAGNPLATLIVSETAGPLNVDVSDQGVVSGFREPPTGGRRVSWCGIAVVSPRIREFFPDRERFSILEPFRSAILSGERIAIHDAKTAYWTDLGSLESYIQAHRDLQGRLPLSDRAEIQEPRPGVWLSSGAFLDPRARATGFLALGKRSVVEAGAVLKDCVIWDDCVIRAGARLASCVVVDGVTVEGEHQDQVLTG